MAAGPAFESRQWRKPRAVGGPISERYGNLAGAAGAALCGEAGIGANRWRETSREGDTGP
jgi:hypothetical protein